MARTPYRRLPKPRQRSTEGLIVEIRRFIKKDAWLRSFLSNSDNEADFEATRRRHMVRMGQDVCTCDLSARADRASPST